MLLGILPPSLDGGRGPGENKDDATVRWIDAQPPKSVMYVALGSEAPLRVVLVHELAGTRFLWALRKANGTPESKVLPSGFQDQECTHDQGMVTMGWIPQITIVARGRCILDALLSEPSHHAAIFSDQGLNARLME